MGRRNREGGREGGERETGILGIGISFDRKGAQQRDPHILGSWSPLIAIPGQASHGTLSWDEAFLGGTGRRRRAAARVVLGSGSWSVIFHVLNVYAYT